jgi:hypothetical protein
MDGSRFDKLTRNLASGVSRRRVLEGIAAGLAGALGMARPAGADSRVELCHHTGSGNWHRITVAEPAVAAHQAHGDYVPIECCGDAECAAPVNGFATCDPASGSCATGCNDGYLLTADGTCVACAAAGSPCLEVPLEGGGFTCIPAEGPCCGNCEGAGGAGDGRCSNNYCICVPDGNVCSEFTTCCSGVCGSPQAPLITRCGACIGEGSGPCIEDTDCCDGLTCVSGDFGGSCR